MRSEFLRPHLSSSLRRCLGEDGAGTRAENDHYALLYVTYCSFRAATFAGNVAVGSQSQEDTGLLNRMLKNFANYFTGMFKNVLFLQG